MESEIKISESEWLNIAKSFDRYLYMIENRIIAEQTTCDNISQIFSYAVLVEAAIARAEKENKIEIFQRMLKQWWKSENRQNFPACSELKKACDKLLEVYIKSSVVPTAVVDSLINLYIRSCGKARLTEFIEKLLTESTRNNVIIDSLEKLGLDSSRLDDVALIESWESWVDTVGRKDVSECIDKMLRDGYVMKLLKLLLDLERENRVRGIIVERFTAKSNVYDVQFILSFLDVDKKLFLKLLSEESAFRTSFIDALFYFGKNMKLKDGVWISSDNRFKHDDILIFMNLLLNGPFKVYQEVNDSLRYAKLETKPHVWQNLGHDSD